MFSSGPTLGGILYDALTFKWALLFIGIKLNNLTIVHLNDKRKSCIFVFCYNDDILINYHFLRKYCLLITIFGTFSQSVF